MSEKPNSLVVKRLYLWIDQVWLGFRCLTNIPRNILNSSRLGLFFSKLPQVISGVVISNSKHMFYQLNPYLIVPEKIWDDAHLLGWDCRRTSELHAWHAGNMPATPVCQWQSEINPLEIVWANTRWTQDSWRWIVELPQRGGRRDT